MQKTKGNLAFAEKYKLVQWLEQNLASLGGRTYESIAQEATKALGYHISDNVLENINRDDELSHVKWRTSRAGAEPQLPYEQLLEEHKQLADRVRQLESKLSDLLSVKRPFFDRINPSIYLGPYNPWNSQRLEVTCADPSIKSMFKGDEPNHAQAPVLNLQ
ncbi:hypothetical protein [uncultured Thiothrix sp.]|uniref:hypothetical protein n=1 Tax=uncultured Thiothrix sp. TaxID=223185 RepID=UPI002616D455|nr:hypothetical protein [uncultured Thiothrix sp.]